MNISQLTTSTTASETPQGGRSSARILMCPPDHYGIEYEINPWMSRQKQADHARAVELASSEVFIREAPEQPAH